MGAVAACSFTSQIPSCHQNDSIAALKEYSTSLHQSM